MKKAFENKKIMLGVLTVVLVFAIIIVSSFWPFILDPGRIFTNQFLTDELIITAITISVTVSMLFVAQAGNAQNEQSELAKSKVEFKISLKRILNRTFFFQWVKKVMQVDDRREIAEREMGKLLIPMQIYDMEESEILTLVEPKEIDGKFYGPYDIKKLKMVVRLKKRIAEIKFVSPNYYTNVKSIDSEKNLSELAIGESLKKVLTVVGHLSMRIILVWIGASILGSLVRDLTQEGGNTAEAWMRFLSRMFAFCTSCFCGYTLGCKMNDLDAFYITKRIEAHTLYVEDKTFVPVDESKEAYEKAAKTDRIEEESK